MEGFKLVVGLGNPGPDYENTRHNAGFLVVNRVADEARVRWTFEKKFKADVAGLTLAGGRLMVCKPRTYMNGSGDAVGALVNFYKIPLDQVLIILDDADLPFGQLRMRAKGGTGGHHGLESIEASLKGSEYARLRVGIGREPGDGRQITGHVLGVFSQDEQRQLSRVLETAARQATCWAMDGPERAMNLYNGAVENTASD